MSCFITKATSVHRKLRYGSKRNKLVQLVGQVQYHKNVIYSLGGGHTHTRTYAYWLHRQKQFQETRHTPAFGQRTPGLKILALAVL